MLEDKSYFQNRIDSLVSDSALSGYPNAHSPSGQSTAIEAIQLQDLFGVPVDDRFAAECCESGIWLLHNYLDRSHEISQSIHTSEGSWWHAIMHRIEGDFGNSKYWYRNVGDHPVFQAIARWFGHNRLGAETFRRSLSSEPGRYGQRSSIGVGLSVRLLLSQSDRRLDV